MWSVRWVIALIIILSIKSKTTIPEAILLEISSATLVIKHVYKKTKLRRKSPTIVAVFP
jgi:hypothetical protein